MRLGIIGLPQSGKSTVFSALTGGRRPVASGGGRFDIHTAVVDVPDPRLERLAGLFKPEKVVYARVTYADVAGLDGDAAGGIPGPLLNQLHQMDGFLHVVRCFEDPGVPHPAGSLDPQRDVEAMDAELLLNDLIAVERKLERLDEERKKGGGREKAVIGRETALFQQLHDSLSQEIPLREVTLSAEDEKALSGFGFLTAKPVLIVLNLGEGQEPPAFAYPHARSAVVSLQARLEMEIAQLPEAEGREFLEDYGIQEPGSHRLLRASNDLLGLISFFTIAPSEVRAWTVPQGTTALEAAGAIHTDLQRGFIRAEVIPWDELVTLGGMAEARARGRLRLEGKEYVLRDGEVMHVRFNV